MVTTPGKVRIKNEEQIRTKKRKRPASAATLKKKAKLGELTEKQDSIKRQDRETEASWSMVNIEDQKQFMSMGLASLQVLDEADFTITRPGKRKKTAPPKTKEKKVSREEKSEEKGSACKRKELSEEEKEKLRQKRKERQAKAKLKRQQEPDLEKEALRKEKLKAKRKAKKALKMLEKQVGCGLEQPGGSGGSGGSHIKESSFTGPGSGSETKEQPSTGPGGSETKESSSEPIVGAGKTSVELSEANVESGEPVVGADESTVESGEPAVDAGEDKSEVSEEKIAAGEEVSGEDTLEPPAVELTEEEKERGREWLSLDVCEPIVKALLELGFTSPTPIQRACIPAGLLKYKDVIGAAETGSGKTLAFGIPLIQRAMRMRGPELRGLVLCPTRELATQVTEHLQAAAKHTGVRVVAIVGGVAPQKQERLLSYRPALLVATPGRLWQLIEEGTSEHLQHLDTLRFLVIDEVDRMVEDGHFEEVTRIIERLPGPNSRNVFLFSATLTFTIARLDEKAKKKKSKAEKRAKKRGSAGLEQLVRNIGVKDKVERVDFTLQKGTATNLKETYFMCNVEEKDLHLYYLLSSHPGKTLVFANAIDGVMNLVHILKELKVKVYPLHSALQQRQRFKFLDRFKEQENATLVCTDVAARGLDIPLVDTVIHYQLPKTLEAYIHRSGRTARANSDGLSIAIVGPKDFSSYKKVARQMSEFPVEHGRLRLLRPIVALARRIFKLERLSTRPAQKEAKLLALAREAGLEGEEEEGESTKKATVGANAGEVKALRAQLKRLFEQPIIDPLNSARYITSKGTAENFQTLSSFSLGHTALQHCKK